MRGIDWLITLKIALLSGVSTFISLAVTDALKAALRRWIQRDEERAKREWETRTGRYADKAGRR
jgi:hypothetical protein